MVLVGSRGGRGLKGPPPFHGGGGIWPSPSTQEWEHPTMGFTRSPPPGAVLVLVGSQRDGRSLGRGQGLHAGEVRLPGIGAVDLHLDLSEAHPRGSQSRSRLGYEGRQFGRRGGGGYDRGAKQQNYLEFVSGHFGASF